MILHKLWGIDPGYFRLKHAFKTILAILIALWLMRDETSYVRAMVGLAAGFSMQGVVAKSYPTRIFQILALNLAYFCSFILGLLVRDSASGAAAVLVVTGFIANYARRFGLQTSVAPMMGWTLCFFATVLPFTDTAEIWEHIYGLIVALSVSALVNCLVFPENYPRLFVWNSNRLFRTLAQGMEELRQYVQGHQKKRAFERRAFVGIKHLLMHLLESNQAIEESDFSAEDNPLSDILIEQYALVNAYEMMLDAYELLGRNKQQLLKPAQDELNIIYKQFELLFASMVMKTDYSVLTGGATVPLPSLVKTLSRTPLTEPAMVLVLLNLKLSFNLLNRHAAKLLRIADET